MMSETPKLRLPFLFAGQAQKELLHNEALQILDSLIHPVLEEVEGREPPNSPAPGSCYIVPDGAIGEWSREDKKLACFTQAGWRFLEPYEGLTAVRQADAVPVIYLNGQWNFGKLRGFELIIDGRKMIGRPTAPIAAPAGGSVVDKEARAALAEVLHSLRSHGLIEAQKESRISRGKGTCV